MKISDLRVGDLVLLDGRSKSLIIYKTSKSIKLKLKDSTIEITKFNNDSLTQHIGLKFIKNVLEDN